MEWVAGMRELDSFDPDPKINCLSYHPSGETLCAAVRDSLFIFRSTAEEWNEAVNGTRSWYYLFHPYYLGVSVAYYRGMRIESIEEIHSAEELPKQELSEVVPCDFGWNIQLLDNES